MERRTQSRPTSAVRITKPPVHYSPQKRMKPRNALAAPTRRPVQIHLQLKGTPLQGPSHRRGKSHHFKDLCAVGPPPEKHAGSKPNSNRNSADLDVEPVKTHQRTCSGEFSQASFATGDSLVVSMIRESFRSRGLPPVTSLKFYQVGKALGTGAFGKVFLGIHKLTGLKVAIKTIDKARIQDDRTRQRVFQEVFNMNRVHHPNVIRLLEVFESAKHLLIILEYAGGGDLLSFLKRRERLPESEAKLVFKQLVEAVRGCHTRNIAHRDVKLDNILLSSDYRQVKLCDFGVSRAVAAGETVTDQCGTPVYLAPEIIQNNGYDPHYADMWSLGVTLYALVTGTMPFRAQSLQELHSLILTCRPLFPSALSAECRDLLGRLIQLVPQQRPTAAQVLEHPWFSTPHQSPVTTLVKLPKFLGGSVHVEESEEVMLKVREYGFPLEYIRRSLKFNDINHATATYNLLQLYHFNHLNFL